MMRKRFLSLLCVLALCLSLLPATALAAAPNGQVIYVGNENVTNGGYWTTSEDGQTITSVGDSQPSSGGYIHYDADDNTLTLHNATIKKQLVYSENIEGGTYIFGSAIGVFNQNGAAELTITLEGTNTIAEVGKGIFVLASSTSTGGATLTITGGGSLDASASQTGIWVQSNNGDATLTIRDADVEAEVTGSNGDGVLVQAGQSSNASLSVNGGSLTATGSGTYGAGIKFQFGSRDYNSGTPSLTVSGNAMVKASSDTGGITSNSSPVTPSGTGIVLNNGTGTVYGSVTLQENLTIGEGESLTIGDGASLDTNGKTITVESGGKLEGTIDGKQPPEITVSPVNQTMEEGSPAAFSFTASAGEGEQLTYQWQQKTTDSGSEWMDISDATNATYTTGQTTMAMSGYQYRCVVTANGVSVISAPATLTVNAAATTITTQPGNVTVTEGETATFSVTATGSNLTYQWQQSTDGSAWANISGATGISYTTQATTMDMNGYQYRCVVTGNGGSVTSDAATLTVTAATVPVTGVTLNKTSTSLYVGDTETLTPTITPDNATNKNLTWSSDTPSVASVNNGVVTAVAPGTATITATTVDGGFTATCTVTVRPDIPPANPNYRITLEATQGGTVTADPTAAKAGATVTLTPVPDRGYQVGTVAVTDRFGDAVAVTEQADGTYTFTMPNGQVTVTVTFAEAPLPFPDVTEGDWFYDAVVYAYENGLMDGVGDNLFAPNSQTTRAQLVTILYRLEGQPAVSSDLPFTDVESGTWYTDAILWAAQNNIVNGVNDTEFAPGADITREQLVTILYRYAESKGYDVSASADLSGYPDADQVQDYAQPAMAWAVAEGIVEGVDGTLNPAGNASRAQIATILMRFCEGVAK